MMLHVVAVALVVLCVVLTVAFVASLRGIAELRIRLAGDDASGVPMLIIGRPLPESLLSQVSDTESVVVFLSATCGSCLHLASELDQVEAPFVACVLGDPQDTAQVTAAIPAGVPVIAGDTHRIGVDMKIKTFPTAVVQRDGFIVVVGQGGGADTAADLDELWRQGISAHQEARA
ncbi:MAG TPA: hypothetical protein VGP16_11570 [Asanoa sp.]|nr:hypothetical protein [Asanoa sp.]